MPERREHTDVFPSPKLYLLYGSPVLLILVIALSDLISDAVGMALISHFRWLNTPIYPLFDSLLLVALLLPTLIIFVLRPIKLHLAQLKRAEEELAAERNKLRGILDGMPAGACIIDSQYRIEYLNGGLLEDFGPVEGRHCYEYFLGGGEVCPECRLQEVLQGKCSSWESRNDRNERVYEVVETPLRNSDGTVSKLTMMHDVTARREAEIELRKSRQQLRSLAVYQRRTREEERAAVSREIHDELGQILATVQLGVSALAEEYQDHCHLVAKIAGMEQLMGDAIRTVQRIATQLRPAILDELGLADAVEWLASDFCAKTGVTCTPDIFLGETELNRDVATALFRICQESLTNVIRHAEATRVSISLEERNRRIILCVADNGRGITREQLRDSQSLGLTGMRERAYQLGGRVRLRRGAKQGTIVCAHIPLTDASGGDPCHTC